MLILQNRVRQHGNLLYHRLSIWGAGVTYRITLTRGDLLIVGAVCQVALTTLCG